MASYNRIIIIGNLTRDPEYKQLSSGQPVSRLGVASNRQYKNKQTGSMVQEVCFIDVDVFGPQAESCRQYLQKGRPVLVEGRLKFDTWQGTDGQTRSKHSIVADRVVFLGSNNNADGDTAGVTENAEPVDETMRALATRVNAIKRAPKVTPSEEHFGDVMNAGELSFKDEPPFQDDLPF